MRSLDVEISTLREEVLLMAARVEKQLSLARRAFATRDRALAAEVARGDDAIDAIEEVIDERCLTMLARRHPVATALRFITTTIKVVIDLERIGDIAKSLCERSLELTDPVPEADRHLLAQMGEKVEHMLQYALDALVRGSADEARRVIAMDDDVDAMLVRLYPRVVDQVEGARRPTSDALLVLTAAQYLERVGDHATNIAEMVQFMVDGRFVRHRQRA